MIFEDSPPNLEGESSAPKFGGVWIFRGSEIPEVGKGGLQSQKINISHHPRKGCSESKNPHFPSSALYRNGDFFTQSALFWGGGKWGFLDSETLLVYEQRRVDLATFRAVPASTWGHCPQVLCFTTVWDAPGKGEVAKWSSAPASILEGFNEIYAVYGPKNTVKHGENAKVAKSTRVCPPTNPPFTILGISAPVRGKRIPNFCSVAGPM